MSETILSSQSLCKSFANNGKQNHVLSEIDLELYKEDFTVIMGASGSGKSTLLYCLSGMDRATSGTITYNGKAISSYSDKELSLLRRGDFGFVFQQMHLVSNLTLLENVAVPGYLKKGVSSAEVNKRANLLLDNFGLIEAKTRLPKQSSGGEQQRAAIARALISEPTLLFADEPTGALNRRNGTDVLNLLSEINRQGQSILMVTHDIRSALRANRLLYLEDGNIIGELTLPPYSPEDIKAREVQVSSWLSSMEW